jgi:hypothetical protein
MAVAPQQALEWQNNVEPRCTSHYQRTTFAVTRWPRRVRRLAITLGSRSQHRAYSDRASTAACFTCDGLHFGVCNWLESGGAATLLGGVIFLDLSADYAIHALLHEVDTLWRIHSVHHSDTLVYAATAFRQHPAERLLRIAFRMSGKIAHGLPF